MDEQRDTAVPIHPDAPAWFGRALAEPFEDGAVEVDGTPIHYLAWGRPDRRGLVFVHGGGAHAHWWTHVAATFARQFRVVAVDLSGHGSRYASPQLIDWAQAIVVMDRHNLEDLRRLYPEAEERTFPLGAFLEQPRQEIEDPYYLDLERATQVYAQMHQAVTTMLSFQ